MFWDALRWGVILMACALIMVVARMVPNVLHREYVRATKFGLWSLALFSASAIYWNLDRLGRPVTFQLPCSFVAVACGLTYSWLLSKLPPGERKRQYR